MEPVIVDVSLSLGCDARGDNDAIERERVWRPRLCGTLERRLKDRPQLGCTARVLEMDLNVDPRGRGWAQMGRSIAHPAARESDRRNAERQDEGCSCSRKVDAASDECAPTRRYGCMCRHLYAPPG